MRGLLEVGAHAGAVGLAARATRAGGQAGWIDFIPNYFSEIPSHIERGQIRADVVLTMASPMDAHGYFSLSLGADYTMTAIAKARLVVLEADAVAAEPSAGRRCVREQADRAGWAIEPLCGVGADDVPAALRFDGGDRYGRQYRRLVLPVRQRLYLLEQ